VPTLSVFASGPTIQINGTYVYNSVVVSSTYVGGNRIDTVATNIAFSGDISGTCIGSLIDVNHANGDTTGHGTCTFTGTVTGGSGSGTAAVSFHLSGIGAGDSFVMESGTGGLTGIHAQVSVPVSTINTYEGQVVFN